MNKPFNLSLQEYYCMLWQLRLCQFVSHQTIAKLDLSCFGLNTYYLHCITLTRSISSNCSLFFHLYQYMSNFNRWSLMNSPFLPIIPFGSWCSHDRYLFYFIHIFVSFPAFVLFFVLFGSVTPNSLTCQSRITNVTACWRVSGPIHPGSTINTLWTPQFAGIDRITRLPLVGVLLAFSS